MPDTPANSDTPAPPPRRNLWQRRIADPIVAQLTQGLTPHKIALTIAIGSAIAMFPIFGTTTLICLLVGIVMRLNQPIIQAVNYACTPIHIPFIVFAFQKGDELFGATRTEFQLTRMIRFLQRHPLDFVERYSAAALHAIIIWAVLVPFWAVLIYYISLPILRGIDRVRLDSAAKAATEKAKEHPVP